MIFLESLFEDKQRSFSLKLVFSIIIIVVSVCILHDNFINVFYSYAQQIERTPGFQDSYWTDKTIAAGNDSNKLEEKEVGPGEGIATLAIVLVNKAQTDISAIKGYLALPDEFEAVKHENITNNMTSTNNNDLSNVAIASYDSIVKPGQEFTLYFDIDIKNDAKVGSYYTYLDLVYSKVLTAGDIVVKDIPISYRIPGKELLDLDTKNQFLTPAKTNKVDINIINKGSAVANNAIITISNDADKAEESLASVSESSSGQSVQQSNSTTANASNTTLTYSADDDQTDDKIKNPSITTFGTLKYDVGNIDPGEMVSINPLIYSSSNAAGTLQNLDIQISYGNSIGSRETIDYNLGLVVNAEPTESNFNVYVGDDKADANMNSAQNDLNNKISNNSMITAGSIEDMTFAIKKSSSQSAIQDVVISLQPSSESVKILGPSRWSFDTITKDILLNTTLFASDELIGKPVQLNFNLDYLLDGIAKSEKLDVGLYVDGNITVRAYDFEINIIGDEPNLVANLLNEGNTEAFFTTAKMIPSSPMKTSNLTSTLNKYDDNDSSTRENLVEEYPPLQYLGDLAENSPLPVSIPLKIPNNTRPGNYPVFIEISYKDNLRNGHNLIVNGTVNYTPQIGNSSNDTGLIFGFINPIILFVMLIVTGIVLYFVIRRFRKKKKNKVIESSADYSDSENDLDSVLRDSDRSNEQK
jgi:hypothetical protein